MSRPDRITLILSALAVIAAFFVHDRVYERMAHLEDEMAYVWEAQTISGGHITLPSPPGSKSFLVPFVVDYNGVRFGKYPPGWPLVLAVGELLDIRFIVNPLLAGLGVWLTYLLGKKVFSPVVGVLAAILTLTSPFFLMNSGSLLSHPMGLVFSTLFVLAWMDAFCDSEHAHKWRAALIAGCALGVLLLTRPFTAFAIGIPFALHGVYLMLRGDWLIRRRLIATGVILLLSGLLYMFWQYLLTGDPFLNPYTLWWEYDKVGFGPGVGHRELGHTINQAWINTRHSLHVGSMDLFGWWRFSWIFLPIGLLAIIRDRNWRALLPISVMPTLVVVYLAYWIGSSLFGPRYFFEGLYSMTLLSGVGIAFLAGWPTRRGVDWPEYSGWHRLRALAVTALVTLLIFTNLLLYTPIRLGGMYGLYDVERAHIEPFLTPSAQDLAPALMIVHTSGTWIEYGTLIELETPYLDTPFIFVISRGPSTDQEVADHFPGRNVYHYYADTPYNFYTAPRLEP